jgi:ribonuclease HII
MSDLFVIGIDEVGRGPIAGPVVVCACAIQVGTDIIQYFPKQQLRDSKKLTEKHRQEILHIVAPLKESREVLFGIGEVSASQIDEIGISQAIRDAMQIALTSLHAQKVPQESFVFLDGSLHAPETYNQETIIKGDEKVKEISLASIFAKEYRDSLMKKVSKTYPEYSFEHHVGYGTRAHYEAIKNYGVTSLHRKSFLKNLV